MKKVIAVLVSFLLVQCEWRDSYAQLFNMDNCCTTTCCAAQCDDTDSENSNDDSSNSSDPMKNCCTACCYLPAASAKVDVFSSFTEIIFSHLSFVNTSFSSGCFHPPELI